jgi:hypothetical protein
MDPAQLNPIGGPVAFDYSQIVARSDSFQALVQGNVFGGQTGTVTMSSDSIVYTESTTIGPLQQQSTVVMNSDLSPRHTDQTSTVQGQKSEIHLTYSGGRVKGTSQALQSSTPKQINVDTTIAPGTIDDNALPLVVLALPLEVGKTFNLNVFSSGEGTTKVVSVKVAGIETVAVPAGNLPSYRLEITGMQLPVVMHVTQQAPRRLVRIAPTGAPIVLELVK